MTNEIKKNHSDDSKAKVLDLQELESADGGVALADWSTASMDCKTVEANEWSTASTGCK